MKTFLRSYKVVCLLPLHLCSVSQPLSLFNCIMVRTIAFSAAAAFLYAVSAVSGEVVSQDGQYNITSPSPNGDYVAGQILPLVYRLNTAALDGLTINAYLTSTANASFIPQTIVTGNDGSRHNPVVDHNITIYQHDFNYNLPAWLAAGPYNVIVESSNTKVNTSIPISIRAAVTSTSSSGSTSSGGSAAATNKSTNGISGASSLQLSLSFIPGALAAAGLIAYGIF
ncbi:hypothetical protein BX666DRAFT_1918311 [Dichotomocladium elegans]|nr:hypothetical protein BX666DRAFT_1918311 [Dichotomocladium elegans]